MLQAKQPKNCDKNDDSYNEEEEINKIKCRWKSIGRLEDSTSLPGSLIYRVLDLSPLATPLLPRSL